MLFPLKVDCSEIEQKRSGIMETQYKNDMIREIESLIQLEMEKVVKKQKEKFVVPTLKLQERITAPKL